MNEKYSKLKEIANYIDFYIEDSDMEGYAIVEGDKVKVEIILDNELDSSFTSKFFGIILKKKGLKVVSYKTEKMSNGKIKVMIYGGEIE